MQRAGGHFQTRKPKSNCFCHLMLNSKSFSSSLNFSFSTFQLFNLFFLFKVDSSQGPSRWWISNDRCWTNSKMDRAWFGYERERDPSCWKVFFFFRGEGGWRTTLSTSHEEQLVFDTEVSSDVLHPPWDLRGTLSKLSKSKSLLRLWEKERERLRLAWKI